MIFFEIEIFESPIDEIIAKSIHLRIFRQFIVFLPTSPKVSAFAHWSW